jgi:hypothetical protein
VSIENGGNQAVILPNLDIVDEVGVFTPFVFDTTFVALGNQSSIYFNTVIDNAKVSGIEVKQISTTSMPTMAPTVSSAPSMSKQPSGAPSTSYELEKTTIRINSGSSVNWTDPATGEVWKADGYFYGSDSHAYNIPCPGQPSDTLADRIYCSERWGGDFAMRFQWYQGLIL